MQCWSVEVSKCWRSPGPDTFLQPSPGHFPQPQSARVETRQMARDRLYLETEYESAFQQRHLSADRGTRLRKCMRCSAKQSARRCWCLASLPRLRFGPSVALQALVLVRARLARAAEARLRAMLVFRKAPARIRRL